jgi:hypothetical protein
MIQISTVEWLAEHGADVMAKDEEGQTGIHLAVWHQAEAEKENARAMKMTMMLFLTAEEMVLQQMAAAQM